MSATLVPICRVVATRLGYFARGRQTPSKPKALFGGVAIALTLFAGAAATGVVQSVPILLLCSAALFLVGVATDLFALKPSTKLVAIIAVASVFLFFDYRLHWAESLTLDLMVTLFWIVGITSAFNLLDDMDGLCAGIALIAGGAFMLTLLPLPANSPQFVQTQYLAVVLGAVAGFLVYNVHPASVVMGDGGSLLIGFNMAAMTLQIAPGRGSDLMSIIAIPAIVLLIPIVDATLVAASRLLPGTGAPDGGEHSSRRLVAIGLSEGAAVGLLWALAAGSGLIAVMADRRQQGIAGLMAITFTIAVALFAVYLARIKVHKDIELDQLVGTVIPLGIEHGYQRRVGEMLLDLLLVSVAYYGAFRLRFDDVEWAANFVYFRQSFPVVLGTQMIALFAVGAYRGMWRYFSLSDGVTVAKGVFVGVVTAQVAILYLYQFRGYAPGIFLVYAMLLFLLLGGSRASFRLLSEFVQRERHAGRRLVIYGAGASGSMAVRHLLNDTQTTYRIIGFVDDDMKMRNLRVHGYSVIGGYDHLVGMIMAGDVDAVVVTHDGPSIAGLPWLCAKYGVSLNRLTIDWREIPTAGAGAVAAGAPVAAAETRVVNFVDARRERPHASAAVDGDSAPAAREVSAGLREVPVAPIKVVHIITRLILGGAQENTLYTAIGQCRDPRFEVTLLCGVDEAGEGNMFAEANRAGVKTVVLPSLVREIRPMTDLRALVGIYRFLRRGSFTIVHTHSSKAGIIGRIAARAARVPVIVHTVHGLAFHEFQSAWKNRLYIRLERFCAPMTHKIISVSDRVGEAAMTPGIGRRDQHVTIYSGIELDLFLSVRDRMSVDEAKQLAGIPVGAPVVGKVARLFPLKGHEQFLAAAVEIARQVPETFFLFVGDGPLRNQIRADADRLGLGRNLVMVGRVPPERVPEYLQAMDVVVHTSLREGIARVLPQAGAVGKPVVTFDLDGAPEVIRDGVSGYLVPALDINHVAERTVELLRDPERRRALGEAGRAFASENFSVERMVERVNALYLELVAQHADRTRPASKPRT